MAQYRYAFDGQQQLVDVVTLPEGRAGLGPFTCIGCGNQLVAKTKGQQREKHFAHKVHVECNEETYLHRLAKQTFCNEYRRCLVEGIPFQIELTHRRVCARYERLFGGACDVEPVRKVYDLTTYYAEIRLEQRDDLFIPDVLLCSQTKPAEKVYVEIAVTHFLSAPKEASGERIIEIHVAHEEDLAPITNHRITEGAARFLNFVRHPFRVPDGECRCASLEYYCLIVYQSGKSCLERGTPETIINHLRAVSDAVLYTQIIDTRASTYIPVPADLYPRLIEDAFERGVAIKNCMLCKYSGPNWRAAEGGPAVYCKLQKLSFESNQAASCQMYRVNPSGVKTYPYR